MKAKPTVASLTPADYNPRKITKAQLEGLGRSMRRFGDLSGIVKNLTTGNLVGGHQRVKHFDASWEIELISHAGTGKILDSVGTVAHGLIHTPFGLWTYRQVRWTLAQEKAANIAANAHGGSFDMQALRGVIADLQTAGEDLTITGLEEHVLERVGGALQGIKEPETPACPKKPVTRPGDLWILGEHRLVCGDATSEEDYARVLQGDRARMVWTDPPWNVDVGHGRRAGIKNDDLPAAQFAELLKVSAYCMARVLEGDIYVVMASREWPALDSGLRAAGLRWAGVISWVKDSLVISRGNYHHRYEPIWKGRKAGAAPQLADWPELEAALQVAGIKREQLLAWLAGGPRREHTPIWYGWREKGRSSWAGSRSEDDVWECPRPKASAEHPTMKPTELVARAVLNSSKKGDVVLDPFGGAGSLILAAEQLGRRGRSIELDPGYCDVIVKRWEALTGKKAHKETK